MTARSARGGRVDAALLVARALARNWFHRPVRLAAAVAGGVGGVLLTTAVLMVAVPVLASTRLAPVDGVAPGVIAVAAGAPAGLSEQLATRLARETGAAASSRLIVASTTMRSNQSAGFTPVMVLGVDADLPAVLDGPMLDAVRDVPPLASGQAYLPRDWAQRQGLGVGDAFELNAPAGVTRVQVAALLDRSVANNGAAVIVPAPTAAAAFDRGRAADVVLLRGDPAVIRERAAPIADGAGDVTTPEGIFASYGRVYRTPLTVVGMFAAVVVLTGGVVLFLTWRLAIADARPILSRLRLVGVRSGDLLAGSGLVLVPVLLVTYAAGGIAGYAVGLSLSSFRSLIINFTGQAFDPSMSPVLPLAGAFAAAVVMFGAAWLSGLSHLRRVTALDAITGRDSLVIEPSGLTWPLVVGAGCLLVAVVTAVLTSGVAEVLALAPLLVGIGVLSAVLPVVAGAAVRAWTSGAAGLLVGRQLQLEWRRNAALGITFAVALVTSITMAGVSSSIQGDINAANERWTRADLYVQAAPLGQNVGGETLPPTILFEIGAVPGVARTMTYSYTSVLVNGGRHLVGSLGGDARSLTAARILDGPPEVLAGTRNLFDVLSGDDVAVSSNFARAQRLGVGSTLDLPVPDGHRTTRVIAVIDDSVSDGGAITLGPDLYRQVAGSSRVFYVGVGLAPGADAQEVARELAAVVGDRYPRAVVLDLDAYRDGIGSVLTRLMASFDIFSWVMFAIAAVVGTATLASCIEERNRSVALTRLVGGTRRVVRGLLGIEAAVTVAIAWLLAVPAALVAMRALIEGQSVISGILPAPQTPGGMIGLSAPLTALAVGAALVIARRSLGERPLAELVADE
jgi:putative ABC transport system permease protein